MDGSYLHALRETALNGQVPVYNAVTGRFENGDAGGGTFYAGGVKVDFPDIVEIAIAGTTALFMLADVGALLSNNDILSVIVRTAGIEQAGRGMDQDQATFNTGRDNAGDLFIDSSGGFVVGDFFSFSGVAPTGWSNNDLTFGVANASGSIVNTRVTVNYLVWSSGTVIPP